MLGFKRVVLIAETTDFGTSMAKAQTQLLQEKGIRLLDTIYVEMGMSDFTPILTRIKATNPPPDAVSAQAVTGETSYNLARQMAEMGIAPSKTTIGITNQVAVAPQFWQSVPNGAYFVFTNNGLPPVFWNDTNKRVAQEYEKVFKSVIPSYALEAYDSIWVLADAIKRAGSTDPKAIIAALETTDIVLAQGHYSFSTVVRSRCLPMAKCPNLCGTSGPIRLCSYCSILQPSSRARRPPCSGLRNIRTHGHILYPLRFK